MSIFTKLRDFVGLNDPVDYEYDYDQTEGEEYQALYQEEASTQPVEDDNRARRRMRERTSIGTTTGTSLGSTTMSNVIGMPGAMSGQTEVMVMEPRSFEEMPQAIQALRERKFVVLNLTMMDPDQAQRAVDFVAGGTYAIDGHQERVGESIFLFTPNCVQVISQSGATTTAPQPQPQVRPTRPAAPTPAWATEQARAAGQ
ncbi:cell division protein SepF [Prochlorothrix hollandica]|uniref:Cell division protein SepF n=1 Tax=Prochlorothrix hollandica PCC 9006 = CALU 1027 TaxID=317619 RepID=A0A0M2PYV0_PROHO|nr:cell division protein SepF [Prochlorothrix hollandica]KKI99853.1 cell division protein SepF [Prochlorothrix hollandica PCC 9006 = CALU 1027]